MLQPRTRQGVLRGSALGAASLGAAGLLLLAGDLAAQQPPPPAPEQVAMTFFITSKGGPDGANYGGVAGADAHCQSLATAVGAGGKTWRAYLSTQAVGGAQAVNARDRIGKGPWKNSAGVQIASDVDDLHKPDGNKINVDTGLTETQKKIPGRLFSINQHDILTGSDDNGRTYPPDKDMTCGNWTKNGDGSAMVGHHDRLGLRDDAPSRSWSTAHPSRGCSPDALKSSGGAGLLYCFAAN